jgi:DNA-binding NtrC family response regulator
MTKDHKGRVLIVDDETNAIKVLSAILSEAGYSIFEAQDIEKAIRIVSRRDIDVIVTDLKMPGKGGMHLFEYATGNHPDIPVIFLTAYGTVESAVNAMTVGAFYYFIKPPDYVKLKSMVAKAIEHRSLKRELETLKKKLSEKETLVRIVGNTPEMFNIFDTVEAVKDSASSILICGETGTGKELIARKLHYSSIRREKPFVTVNCAAIPRELIESELFGYEKGAFTGAHSRRIGRFEEASDGTIFLDEIGELDLSLQAKLLRVLQEKEVERLGSNKKIRVEFRLISSTNRDLQKEIRDGNFREDLFYRINVVQINTPALRDIKDDIPLLVFEFIKEFCVREKKVLTASEEVMSIFQTYPWPGNIRQLKNIVERAVVLSKGNMITKDVLTEELRTLSGQSENASKKTLRDLKVKALENALKECGGNKSKAANMLGISRKAFYKLMRESAL